MAGSGNSGQRIPLQIDPTQWADLLTAIAAGGTNPGGGDEDSGGSTPPGRYLIDANQGNGYLFLSFSDGSIKSFALGGPTAISGLTITGGVLTIYRTDGSSAEVGSFAGGGGNGLSAYELAAAAGYTGTLTEWLESLKGQPGKSAFELAQDRGYSATEIEWLASLQGHEGLSAYQLAVVNGYTGTVDQWLTDLNGHDGKSAYELAQATGFSGTEAQWLQTLKGRGVTGVSKLSDGVTARFAYTDGTHDDIVLPAGPKGTSITGVTVVGTTATVHYSDAPDSTFTIPVAPLVAPAGSTQGQLLAVGLNGTVVAIDAPQTGGGTGTVKSVNNKTPDPQGNVQLTASDIGVPLASENVSKVTVTTDAARTPTTGELLFLKSVPRVIAAAWSPLGYGGADAVTSASAVVPLEARAGDLLLAIVGSNNTPTLTGWNQVLTQSAPRDVTGAAGVAIATVYSLVASASSAGSTVTVTQASSQRLGIGIIVIRAANTPFIVTSAANNFSVASSTSGAHTMPSITATVRGQLGLIFATCAYAATGADTTWVAPAGWSFITPATLPDTPTYSRNRLVSVCRNLAVGENTGIVLSHNSTTHDGGHIALLIGG